MTVQGSVAVLGATGFLGGHVLERLLEHGVDAWGVSRSPVVRQDGPASRRSVVVDTGDPSALTSTFRRLGIGAVINCAGWSGSRISPTQTPDLAEANVLLPVRVLLAAQAAGVSGFTHLSSVLAYPARLGRPDVAGCYGVMKASADLALTACGRASGMAVTVVCSSNVYGPGQRASHFVPSLVDALRRGEPVAVWRGAARRWRFVRDLADAVWAVAQFGRGGASYDVGGDCLSPLDIAHLLARHLGSVSRVREEDPPPGTVTGLAVPAGVRDATELGWRPTVDPDTGFALTAAAAAALERDDTCSPVRVRPSQHRPRAPLAAHTPDAPGGAGSP